MTKISDISKNETFVRWCDDIIKLYTHHLSENKINPNEYSGKLIAERALKFIDALDPLKTQFPEIPFEREVFKEAASRSEKIDIFFLEFVIRAFSFIGRSCEIGASQNKKIPSKIHFLQKLHNFQNEIIFSNDSPNWFKTALLNFTQKCIAIEKANTPEDKRFQFFRKWISQKKEKQKKTVDIYALAARILYDYFKTVTGNSQNALTGLILYRIDPTYFKPRYETKLRSKNREEGKLKKKKSGKLIKRKFFLKQMAAVVQEINNAKKGLFVGAFQEFYTIYQATK